MLNMKWKKAADILPEHNQEVLFNVEGSFYVAIYNGSDNHFKVRDGRTFKVGSVDMYWAHLIDPTTGGSGL
jgi:hypothetical protein